MKSIHQRKTENRIAAREIEANRGPINGAIVILHEKPRTVPHMVYPRELFMFNEAPKKAKSNGTALIAMIVSVSAAVILSLVARLFL
jgi:hypothetical protein